MQPSYDAPRRKSNTGLIIGLILGGIGLCCVLPLVLFGGAAIWGVGKVKGSIECTLAYNDLNMAIREYAKEHNGMLPAANQWQSEVLPYYKKAVAKHGKDMGPFSVMPAEGVWGCKTEKATTGIAFNQALSGKKLEAVKDASETPLLFEIEAAKMNATEPYKPRDNSKGPIYIMGQRRPWIVLYASGRLEARDSNGSPLPDMNKGQRSSL